MSEGKVMNDIQSLLRERLCSKCVNNLCAFDNEKRQLHGLIQRTATMGESNSILVVGPRGSGKSTLLQGVLQELTTDTDIAENLLQVRLNGLMQTDDRLALTEITRQLQLENAAGDRVFGSFSENLQFLLDALKSGDKASKSILFVLDEFDLFAHHRNQTLLYNLFDVAQSAQAPICVVGLTVRLDVLELLEKRVKSRFSHRFLHLLPTYSFQDYVGVCLSVLSLPKDFRHKHMVKEWNRHVESLLKESSVIGVLQQQFNINKSIRLLHQLLMLPVCSLSPDHPQLLAGDLLSSFKLLHKDCKAAVLQGVSVLELTLVLAMKHLNEVYGGEPFNFEMVFNVYKKFCQRASLQLFEKPVVMKAFEHLCALELVRPADGSTSKTQKEYRCVQLMAENSQILEALKRYPACPSELKHWATTPLVTL